MRFFYALVPALCFLVSPLASACPTINGTFLSSFRLDGEMVKMVFKTEVRNGRFIYTNLESEDPELAITIADGRPRQLNHSRVGPFTQTALCRGRILEITRSTKTLTETMTIEKLNEDQLKYLKIQIDGSTANDHGIYNRSAQ